MVFIINNILYQTELGFFKIKIKNKVNKLINKLKYKYGINF
jgi:hypothetical protein